MGTHLRVIGESYLMNTNMTEFKGFSKTFASFAWDESSLSIGGVKPVLGSSGSFTDMLMNVTDNLKFVIYNRKYA